MAQSHIDSDCVIRGNSTPPPPFLVVRWTVTGECNSTIDYYLQFYDIKSVISKDGEYIMFLET